MATSLCFGLMFTTLLVLLLVPVFYLVYAKVVMPETEMPETAPEVEAPAGTTDRDEQVEMLTG